MILTAVLPALAAAATPAAPAGEYPARAVLAAFATACSGVEDTAVNLASATAAGWERLPAEADTPVSRVVRAGAEAARKQAGTDEEPIPGAEFRRTVAGRQLYLAISGMRLGKSASRGCRLFDFDAPRDLTDAELHDWAVRDPADSPPLPIGVTRRVYHPGLKPGHASMEVFYVPPGGKPLPGFDLGGLTFVAHALEL